MATYVGRFRTNYFSVTDKDAFTKWLETYVNGAEKIVKGNKVGFSDFGSFYFHGLFGEDVDESDAISSLQKLLADGDACVSEEIGYEKFRYLNSVVTIITKDTYKCLDFDTVLTKEVQGILNDPNFTVDLTY